jgi:hypothetical protein
MRTDVAVVDGRERAQAVVMLLLANDGVDPDSRDKRMTSSLIVSLASAKVCRRRLGT